LLEIFAITNRGIEAVCAEEMARIPGLQVTQTAYRRVHAAFTGELNDLLTLRTVDDLFIYLAEWQGISPHRSALAAMSQMALDLELWQAANVRAEIHPLSAVPTFSVSANFVGRRNYSADEIKSAIAGNVEMITGWRYEEDDRRCEINLRLFIEHGTAIVGMRLANRPLYKRAYKQEHLPGSLKPSVAAALLFVAGVSAGDRLLDPYCGAGTILIEAAALGATTMGGDHEESAVAAARENNTEAGIVLNIQRWDGRALPIHAASVDKIVTNLPWGRQVGVDTSLVQFYQAACEEMERVLVGDGRVVVLTNLPSLVRFPNRCLERQIEISLYGQQPTILRYGPIAKVSDQVS
jgi:23S rRNA G2445 N2-methylase RlmL